jgi:hypothetical protein
MYKVFYESLEIFVRSGEESAGEGKLLITGGRTPTASRQTSRSETKKRKLTSAS